MTLISHDFCPFQASGRKKFVKKILFTRSNLNQRFCNQGPQGFNLAEFEARSFFDYFHVQLIILRGTALKRICHLQILIGVLYMQLTVCKAVVLSCFFVYSFVYLFIYYSFYISSLCVFLCICLSTTTLISSYFSAWLSHSVRLAFAISERLCSLFFTIISL